MYNAPDSIRHVSSWSHTCTAIHTYLWKFDECFREMVRFLDSTEQIPELALLVHFENMGYGLLNDYGRQLAPQALTGRAMHDMVA